VILPPADVSSGAAYCSEPPAGPGAHALDPLRAEQADSPPRLPTRPCDPVTAQSCAAQLEGFAPVFTIRGGLCECARLWGWCRASGSKQHVSRSCVCSEGGRPWLNWAVVSYLNTENIYFHIKMSYFVCCEFNIWIMNSQTAQRKVSCPLYSWWKDLLLNRPCNRWPLSQASSLNHIKSAIWAVWSSLIANTS